MPIYDFHKTLSKYVVDRICFECDLRYKGLLYCHRCGQPSGEPVDMPRSVAETGKVATSRGKSERDSDKRTRFGQPLTVE